MSNQEADAVARYIELLQERVRQLSAYVKDAAGDESCLLPISTLSKLFYLTEDERVAVLHVLDHADPGPEFKADLLSARARLESADRGQST